MGQRFLIDTSIVAKYLRNEYDVIILDFIDSVVKPQPINSFITKIELLSYNMSVKCTFDNIFLPASSLRPCRQIL